MTIAVDMGVATGGGAVGLDLEELLATRLLVQGNSGSGKSHLLRRLLEQSASLVQQIVIDPEGDFVTLADKFGHLVVDAARTEGELTGIAGRIRQHRVSAVLNLEGLDVEQQMRGTAAFLGGLFEADRDYWYPALVVVDEAQLFAPAVAGEVSDEARKLSGDDQPDVPRAQARARWRDCDAAAREAGQERCGRSIELPDGAHLPRYRHGARC
jgi:DNA helicase HerA-like ATPase